MNNAEIKPNVTSHHPLKTMSLFGLTIAVVIGSGSYFSSTRHEAEPTVERSAGLVEMVFGMR